MSTESEDFRQQYKQHPVRISAVSEFKETNKYSVSKDVRQYMCQVMATIGLELESRFSKYVDFDDKRFKLFGREKSEKSISTKKKLNIQDYDQKFQAALENKDELPAEVRPIFDFYAFKFVCPEIGHPREIINTVISDILADIEERYPQYSSYTSEFKNNIDMSHFVTIDFINSNFPDVYPGLKDKFLTIMNEQHMANKTQDFLDAASSDVSSLTLSEYYSKIIECYQLLISLSYKESTEEYEAIAHDAKEAREEFEELLESGKSANIIDEDLQEEYSNRLQTLLDHVSRKKTNKLDLALADLMFFDVLNTSSALRNLGVSYSKDPTRTKQKRNPNGYIADFYSLDMPNGLTSEIQLQSAYRYTYGESGPAAHNKMENGIKKRTLYKRPKDKSKYADWAKKQFKALPRYFSYRGKGYVEVYNTLQNFRRYYDCKDKDTVQTYVEFIAQHDIDLFDSKLLSFTLDDEPVSLELDSAEHNDDNESR